eukprot:tig00001416_g8962.t1
MFNQVPDPFGPPGERPAPYLSFDLAGSTWRPPALPDGLPVQPARASETTTASLAVGRRVSHLPSDFHGGELDSIVSWAHLKCLRRLRRARAREEYTSLASSAHPRRRRRASYTLSLVRGIRALNRVSWRRPAGPAQAPLSQ